MSKRAPKPKGKDEKKTAAPRRRRQPFPLEVAAVELLAASRVSTNTFTPSKPVSSAPIGEGQSEHAELLLEMAQALDDAERAGPAEDVPEGTRWVRLSHTLAVQMAARLRMIAGRMEK